MCFFQVHGLHMMHVFRTSMQRETLSETAARTHMEIMSSVWKGEENSHMDEVGEYCFLHSFCTELFMPCFQAANWGKLSKPFSIVKFSKSLSGRQNDLLQFGCSHDRQIRSSLDSVSEKTTNLAHLTPDTHMILFPTVMPNAGRSSASALPKSRRAPMPCPSTLPSAQMVSRWNAVAHMCTALRTDRGTFLILALLWLAPNVERARQADSQ